MRKKLGIFIFIYSVVCTVRADITDNSKELSRIQSEISNVIDSMKLIERDKNVLVDELAKIETRYGEKVKSIKLLGREIETKRQKIQELKQESVNLQTVVKEHHRSLGNQIKAAYAMGRKEKLKLILNMQDPALSSRMMVYYDYFNKDRLEKLSNVNNALGRILSLEQEKKQEAAKLNQELDQIKQEQNELALTRDQRKKLLVQLDSEYSNSKKKLDNLKGSEQYLQNLIEKLERSQVLKSFRPAPSRPFVNLKGKLPWPISGKVTKKFGSPRLGSRWDGVLISAEEGTEIRAVSKGKVVFANWLRGYGLLSIIDHGNGFMTLYAFNQSLFKAVGDEVASGDIIATVGKSGGRSHAGLYFGIRKKGRPVDPVRWCRK